MLLFCKVVMLQNNNVAKDSSFVILRSCQLANFLDKNESNTFSISLKSIVVNEFIYSLIRLFINSLIHSFNSSTPPLEPFLHTNQPHQKHNDSAPNIKNWVERLNSFVMREKSPNEEKTCL